MTTQSVSDIELETRIAAKPEAVFPLLSEAAGMARWFGRDVQLEAKPGGLLRADINGRDIARGEIVEIVPNERVVFTFGWEGENHPVPAGSTRVEISLQADGEGTIVRLRHTGLSDEAAVEHKKGWEHYLERLTAVGEGRDPGPDSFAE